MTSPDVHVEFCGEVHPLDPAVPFFIGRDADLSIEDNPYLHRRFLKIAYANDLWWLANVGSLLTATVADGDGRFQAWLAPGVQVPLVFERTAIRFIAGPTAYELDVVQSEPVFSEPVVAPGEGGETTIGRTTLTPDQRLLIVALAEPALRQEGRGASVLPSNAQAAERLGWTMTKFNRKLDNVCQKLARIGVRGVHGGPDQLAANRRARLVEYALSMRLVTASDLPLLDQQPESS